MRRPKTEKEGKRRRHFEISQQSNAECVNRCIFRLLPQPGFKNKLLKKRRKGNKQAVEDASSNIAKRGEKTGVSSILSRHDLHTATKAQWFASFEETHTNIATTIKPPLAHKHITTPEQ
ncbi:hypothetical protein TNCT_210011 [Trichonephila clavata]|uniref:Uncharacterized protein n=1 Tax=Trichonephila clavata TaxID=2740835 RepID=A0A8X6F0U6_TRICU|nr:hypothetical protein TNCT_210011 [Trichonephila clavata]